MLPAFAGLLLWPRRKKRSNERNEQVHVAGWELTSHCVSSFSLSSSDDSEQTDTPAKNGFAKCIRTKKPRKPTFQPRTDCRLVCYLCGGIFRHDALLDHVDGCAENWMQNQAMKSIDQRLHLPPRPKELDQPLPRKAKEVETFNKAMRCLWHVAINQRCGAQETRPTGGRERSADGKDGEKTEPQRRVVGDVVPRRPLRPKKSGEELEIRSRRALMHTMDDVIQRAGEDVPDRSYFKKWVETPVRGVAVKRREGRSKSFTGAPLPKILTEKDWAKPYGSSYEERRLPAVKLQSSAKVVLLKQTSAVATPKKEEKRDEPPTPPKKPSVRPVKRVPAKAFVSEASTSTGVRSAEATSAEDSRTRRYMRRWSISEVAGESSVPSARRLDKTMSAPSGPRGYTCYLCGRQFGSASLAIHMRQCRQLWEDHEALKRRRDRRPPPTPPPELQAPLPTDRRGMQEFNEKMLSVWERRSLLECPYCARTFNEEAFEKHQKICTAEKPGGPLGLSKHRQPTGAPPTQGAASSSEDGGGRRPVAYSCYLCGRQYGRQSWFLHLPRCQKLWQDREAQKPEGRRPLPPLPPELASFPDVVLPTEPQEVLDFNNAMYAYWDRISLNVCTRCGRSFNEESFERHRQLCKGAVAKNVRRDVRPPMSAKLYRCHLCGKKFAAKSLPTHVEECEKHWLAAEASKTETCRRQLPPRPTELARDLPTDAREIAQFNDVMLHLWQHYVER